MKFTRVWFFLGAVILGSFAALGYYGIELHREAPPIPRQVVATVLSLLPVGLMQMWASVEHGLWYARSAECLRMPLMDTLRWMRVIGDTIFATGILALGWFVLGLKTGWSLDTDKSPALEGLPRAA